MIIWSFEYYMHLKALLYIPGAHRDGLRVRRAVY